MLGKCSADEPCLSSSLGNSLEDVVLGQDLPVAQADLAHAVYIAQADPQGLTVGQADLAYSLYVAQAGHHPSVFQLLGLQAGAIPSG